GLPVLFAAVAVESFGIPVPGENGADRVRYPGVSAIDLAGQQFGSPAGRIARYPIRTVLLAPGKSAQFLLQLNDSGFFPRVACRPSTAAELRVYLPGASRASVVPVPFGACSRTGALFLHATAI